MAYLEKCTIGYKRRFDLKEWNSLELSMMPTVHFSDGDDIDEVMRETWEFCRRNIQHAAEPIVTGKDSVKARELFLGLPLRHEELEYSKEKEEFIATNESGEVATGATPDEALANLRGENIES